MATTTRPVIGTTFRTDDTNPVNGEFACEKCEASGKRQIIKIAQGEKFPKCEKCNAATDWRLVSYA